jgi:hypothetical protein
MTKIVVLPIDFLGQGALLEPADQKLHDMAVEYVSRELEHGKDLNLSKFLKCWVEVVMDGSEYKEVTGFTGVVWRIDVPVFRVTGTNPDRCTMLLVNRLRSWLEDNGGRNTEVFLHISSKETPEQRCAKWEESLKAVGAVPADRFSVKV